MTGDIARNQILTRTSEGQAVPRGQWRAELHMGQWRAGRVKGTVKGRERHKGQWRAGIGKGTIFMFYLFVLLNPLLALLHPLMILNSLYGALGMLRPLTASTRRFHSL